MSTTMVEAKKESEKEGRCIWCNKKSDSLRKVVIMKGNRHALRPQKEIFYVHISHEVEFRSFANKVKRYGKTLLSLLGFAIFLIAGFEVILLTYDRVVGLIGISIVTALIGLVLIIMPFTNMKMVQILGANLTSKLIRTVGVLVVAVGIWLLTLSYY